MFWRIVCITFKHVSIFVIRLLSLQLNKKSRKKRRIIFNNYVQYLGA